MMFHIPFKTDIVDLGDILGPSTLYVYQAQTAYVEATSKAEPVHPQASYTH
jgi:hypothetical protein